jgi:hypothetical protein
MYEDVNLSEFTSRYMKGESIRDLARLFQISYQNARTIRKHLGLTLRFAGYRPPYKIFSDDPNKFQRKYPIPDVSDAEIKSLDKKCKTLAEMSIALNTTTRIVIKLLKRAQLPKKRPNLYEKLM